MPIFLAAAAPRFGCESSVTGYLPAISRVLSLDPSSTTITATPSCG